MAKWQLDQRGFGERLCWMLVDRRLDGIAFLEKMGRPD